VTALLPSYVQSDCWLGHRIKVESFPPELEHSSSTLNQFPSLLQSIHFTHYSQSHFQLSTFSSFPARSRTEAAKLCHLRTVRSLLSIHHFPFFISRQGKVQTLPVSHPEGQRVFRAKAEMFHKDLLSMPTCWKCYGSQHIKEDCAACKGRGVGIRPCQLPHGDSRVSSRICPRCDNDGFYLEDCTVCDGSGWRWVRCPACRP
jgi:hypothetical protein